MDPLNLETHQPTGRFGLQQDEISAVIGDDGTATASGTGSAVAFNIPHGLSGTPLSFYAQAASAAAAAPFYVTATATNLVVTFLTAPASGTNNLSFNWKASLA